MEHFLQSLAFLIIAGVAFIGLQRIFASVPEQKQIRPDTKLDLTYWFIESAVMGLVVKFFIAILVTFILLANTNWLGGIGIIKVQDIYIQILIALVVIDFAGYWIHRMFHIGFGWKLHSIHHSSKELDWISAVRFHPLETICIVTLQYIFAALFLGYTNPIIGTAMVIRSVYGYFVHANIKWHYGILRYIFASPVFHRWHHTMEADGIDKNFAGIFSAWDYMFGTAYLPEKGKTTPHNFGVKYEVGGSMLQQFIYPFREKRVLKKRLKAKKLSNKE